MEGQNINKKTLYIYDLDPLITERQLTSAFKEEGYAVVYIKINKPKYPDRLSTAFVNFDNEEDARKALETLNHLTLGKTELCIVYATDKPTGAPFSYPKGKTVFVKGIPEGIETVVLIKIFSSMFGEVENLRIMRDKENKTLGYGYITFKNEEDAKKAIDHDKDQEMKFQINNEKKSFKFEFYEYVNRDVREKVWTNTYCNNFPKSWDDKKLKEFAQRTGPTKSVVWNYKENLGLTYGFVDFENHDDAEKFLSQSGLVFDAETLEVIPEGTVIPEGKECFKLYVNKYMSRSQRIAKIKYFKQHGHGLFIADFGPEITLKDIKEEFGKYGKIFSSTIYPKNIHPILPGADPRFPRALIVYDEEVPDAAQKAIEGMNKARTLNGKALSGPLSVDEYKSRGNNAYLDNKTAGRRGPQGYAKGNGNRNYGNQNQMMGNYAGNYQGGNGYNNSTNNGYQRQGHNNINNASPGDFFQHQENKVPDEAMGTARQVPMPTVQQGANTKNQLEDVVKIYLSDKHPEQIDKLERILDIFTQMLSEEEIQQCISNQNHIADYITAILEEM